jgi:hypothetical protein
MVILWSKEKTMKKVESTELKQQKWGMLLGSDVNLEFCDQCYQPMSEHDDGECPRNIAVMGRDDR